MPSSQTRNSVVGTDFYHRWPEFVGDLDLQATIDFVGSTGSGTADDGESFGIQLEGGGREGSFGVGTRWVSDDFDPALGFVVRRGSRASTIEAGYGPRFGEGSVVRSLQFQIDIDRDDA